MNHSAVLNTTLGSFDQEAWNLDYAPEDVILEVELTGVCGSDVHVWKGEWPAWSCPVVLGHEIVGRIAAAPEGLRDLQGKLLQTGDRVVVGSAYYGNCGHCQECTQLQAPWMCPYKKEYSATINNRKVAVFGGGFSRYLHLSFPDTRVLLAIDAPAEAAVLHEPLSVVVSALMRGPHPLGAEVVVQGTGALGLMAIALARAAGANRVIAVGGPSHRLTLAYQLGADEVVDIEQVTDPEERKAVVRSYTTTGHGADICYEFAGVPSAPVEGLSYLRPGGVLAEAGAAADVGSTLLNPYNDLWRDNRRIVSVRGRTSKDFIVAARYLESASAQLAPLVTHKFGIDSVKAAFTALTNNYTYEDQPVVKAVIAPTESGISSFSHLPALQTEGI